MTRSEHRSQTDAYVGDWVIAEDGDMKDSVGRHGDHDLGAIAATYLEAMGLAANHRLLDVCCGNGLVTRELAHKARAIDGIDFSEMLIAQAKANSMADNITYRVGDATKLGDVVEPGAYDRISMIAAFQHFDKAEIGRLLAGMKTALAPGGVILISDIPDAKRKVAHRVQAAKRLIGLRQDKNWASIGGRFGYLKRHLAHLFSKTDTEDRLGWWWRRADLIDAAAAVGLECTCLDQPDVNPHHFYRFDAVMRAIE